MDIELTHDQEMRMLTSSLRATIEGALPFTQRALLNALFNLAAFYAIQFNIKKTVFLDCLGESFDNITQHQKSLQEDKSSPSPS